ncbi:MAG: HAD-IA family hydrolase [Aquificaceae bacterium]|nr:HAD-IA family hydrolase [Aquificaceae bacterium]MCS7307013.1 HAD-IA family hydrolase [Aquificaceae bacterium]MDW8433198.1 HAD-IA family hydrolase [Aquificaceae bacterium]
MYLKAVLFDLDGTLIDSYKDIGIHLNKTLRQFGRQQVDIEDVKHMVGGGARELLSRFFSDELLEEALEVFREHYMAEPVCYTKPFEGVEEALKYLKDRGIKLAVVTNKMESLSSFILEKLGLTDYFCCLVGGDTYPEKKPSPLPLLEVMKSVRVSPEEAIMIGDTDTDLKAGRLAGVNRGLAMWGYVRVKEEKPDFILESPLDLKKLV